MKNLFFTATVAGIFFGFAFEANAAGISTSRSNIRTKSKMMGDSVANPASDDAMQSDVKSPRDPASGQATGKRSKRSEAELNLNAIGKKGGKAGTSSSGGEELPKETLEQAAPPTSSGAPVSSPEASMEKLCPGSPNCPPEPAEAKTTPKPIRKPKPSDYDLKEMK